MRCVAQGVHDQNIFWVKLHGGKVRHTFNYRKHISLMKTHDLTKESKTKIDSLAEKIFKRQEAIGRQRASNKHKR